MFGTYRILLATMVVFLHLAGMPVVGAYAVFGFYILSGYLMTLVMQSNYGYTRIGAARYALNRFLRIYPIYWVSCLFSLSLIAWFGEGFVRTFHPALYYPDGLVSILRNIFLIISAQTQPVLTPPSWALTVEIFFYITIGLGLSKSRSITLVWFFVSIGYTVAVNGLGLDWSYKYYIIPAASLPFSSGALIYHYRDRLVSLVEHRLASEYAPAMVFTLVSINWVVGFFLDTLRSFSFYINYILCVMAVVVLLNKRSLPFVSKKLDKVLGDFSYPIYLIHFQIGLVVLVLLNWVGYDFEPPDIIWTLVSLLFIFPVAWLMTRYIELPIELLRSRVKADDPPPAKTNFPAGKPRAEELRRRL